MTGCDWCGYTGSGWDEEHLPHRIDPAGCGCTDCFMGWSRPLDKATETHGALVMAGLIRDATGRQL